MIAGIIVPVPAGVFRRFPLLLVAYLAPLLGVKAWNDVVSDSEKVLTSKHQGWFGGLFRVRETEDDRTNGLPLVLVARGPIMTTMCTCSVPGKTPGFRMRGRSSPMGFRGAPTRSCSITPSRASPCGT